MMGEVPALTNIFQDNGIRPNNLTVNKNAYSAAMGPEQELFVI